MGSAPLIQPEITHLPYPNYVTTFQGDSGVDLLNEGVQSSRTVDDTYTPGFGSTNPPSLGPIDPQIYSQSGSFMGEESYERFDHDIVGSQPSDNHSERAPSFSHSSPAEQFYDMLPLIRYTSSPAALSFQPATSNHSRLLGIPPKIHGHSGSTGSLRFTAQTNTTRVDLANKYVCDVCNRKLKDKGGLV
jgi:hypothetical protein